MSESTATCVICQTERPAIHGLLCTSHYERVAQWLHEIEVEAAILSPVKSMQVASGNRGAGLASERSPARLDAIVMRDRRTVNGGPVCEGPVCDYCWHDTCLAYRPGREALESGSAQVMSILGVLGSWAAMVREERELTPPDQVTVVSERRTLSFHRDWISEQPWVDEFATELRQLRTALKAANGTADDKPYGRCYLDLTGDGRCGGPIWVDTAAGHAYCGKCKQTWDGAQVGLLKKQLDDDRAEAARPKTEDGRPMRTAEELAADKGLTVNAVRLRLSGRGAKAVGGYYDPEWLSKASA